MKTLKIRKTTVAALALMMVIPTSTFTEEAPSTEDLSPQARSRVVEFQVDGKKVNANPDMGKWLISKNRRTYLPIRLFKNAMGYDMRYSKGRDYDAYTLILTKSKKGLKSYSEITYGHELDGISLDVDFIYTVDKADDVYTKDFEKDEFPTLYGNRLYMPAHKVLETVDEEVQWKSLPDRDIVDVVKK